MTSETWWRR